MPASQVPLLSLQFKHLLLCNRLYILAIGEVLYPVVSLTVPQNGLCLSLWGMLNGLSHMGDPSSFLPASGQTCFSSLCGVGGVERLQGAQMTQMSAFSGQSGILRQGLP